MTRLETLAPSPLRMPVAALIGALALAGCSSGHIGESWQCPLAKGGSCDSVAAADPAVPNPVESGETVLAQPLWQVQETGQPGVPVSAAPCEADCGGSLDPIAWLVRLFGGDGEGRGGRAPGSVARPPGSGAGTGSLDPGAGSGGPAVREPEPVTADAAPQAPALPAASKQNDRTPEPETVALPAESASMGQDPAAGDLRTNEIVARIWIAPFVDADGVYREASHVRVVLEPAGWRLK